MPKYIFVTGGVVSSLGKGLAASSIGALLEARGLTVLRCKARDGRVDVADLLARRPHDAPNEVPT